MTELFKLMLKYLNDNLGITFIGVSLLLSTIIYVAYKVSSYIIKLNKEGNPNTFICYRHEEDLKEHGIQLKDHTAKLNTMHNGITDIRKGVDSIDRSVATMMNRDVQSILWKKAEGAFRYLTDLGLRKLVLYKVRGFIEFADLAAKDIEDKDLDPEGTLTNVLTSLELGAQEVSIFFSKCGNEDFYKAFDKAHHIKVDGYRSIIETIILDPIDNHKQRFVDASVTFMHEFVSLLINTWMSYNYIDRISTDEELARKIDLSSTCNNEGASCEEELYP